MRRAAKIDANQPEIVKALRNVGAWVKSTAAIGDGFPDLLVWFRGYHLLEVKDGSLPPSERKLTPKQQLFHDIWPGPIHVVNNSDEALRAIGAI